MTFFWKNRSFEVTKRRETVVVKFPRVYLLVMTREGLKTFSSKLLFCHENNNRLCFTLF